MAITTVAEVKDRGSLTSEYSNEEILTEIDIVEAELYQKYQLPKRSQFTIDDDYTDFFIYPDKIYEIIRVQAQVETTEDPSGYISIGSDGVSWIHTAPNNYLTLGSDFITTYDTKLIRVRHIPKIFNLLAANIAALNLIDTTTVINGRPAEAPLATTIKDRIQRYKDILKPKGITRSSANAEFDKYDYVSYSQTELR